MSKINPKVFLLAAGTLAKGWDNNETLKYSPYCCDNITDAAYNLHSEDEWSPEIDYLEFFGALFDPKGTKQNMRARLGWWPEDDYESRLIALCLAAEIARDRAAAKDFVEKEP